MIGTKWFDVKKGYVYKVVRSYEHNKETHYNLTTVPYPKKGRSHTSVSSKELLDKKKFLPYSSEVQPIFPAFNSKEFDQWKKETGLIN